MQKKKILVVCAISLGVAGSVYLGYKRLLKISSRAYKSGIEE